MQITILDLHNYSFLEALFSLFFSFFVSYKLYPILIYLSHIKNLFPIKNERSSHLYQTPTFGGVAIFFGFALTISFIGSILGEHLFTSTLLGLIASLLILFFIGLKDDLLVISPFKKFIAQLLSTAIIVIFSDIRITSFNGIFGIYELPYLISILFTFFSFVLVINAYNLIDGVDGLAGTIALMISFFLGIYFLINNQLTQVLISFSLIGSIIAFLRFNFSSTNKIFMGDTGSMVIGFIIIYQSISFLHINESVGISFHINHGAIFILSLLSFPLADTTRVFFLRIINGKNPFKPDRNHIHHRFLDTGYTHISTTIVILSLSLVVMVSAFLLQGLGITLHLCLISIISFVVYLFFPLKSKVRSSLISIVK